ncbi:hypothetical protein BC829DRAFT_364906 [Chytridium lagenaria]|nr:hypothetical protein BC829DRAFT_364906 [Chytridium lagenaria]
MTLYFLYKYSWSLEESVYANRKADYAFLVLFCMIVTLVSENPYPDVVFFWLNRSFGCSRLL